MRYLLALASILICPYCLIAQNVGIGTNNPLTKLQVEGSFSTRASYIKPVNAPTAAQTFNMVNGNLATWGSSSDSIIRFYDPGGPAGGYLPGLTSDILLIANNEEYVECTIESIQLGLGDSIWFYDGMDMGYPLLYRAGNGFTGNNLSLNFSRGYVFCRFKSNNDASVGAGFSLLFKRNYFNSSITDPGMPSGRGMFFFPQKAAFHAGLFNQHNPGYSSVALGNYNITTGTSTVAIGGSNISSGNSSVSIGLVNRATGNYSFAVGFSSDASAVSSTAIGSGCSATGNYSFATGNSTIARSVSALAIGRYNDTLAAESPTTWQATDRAFVIGDGTGTSSRSSCFYILKNGNGWMQGILTQASDARLKKDIIQLTDVLPKLLRLNGYNYYWKDKQNMPGLQTGFIAQEIEKEMPELVTTNTEGQLAVNYNGMIPYLLQGIKEQQDQIKKLQDEINSLKKLVMKKQ